MPLLAANIIKGVLACMPSQHLAMIVVSLWGAMSSVFIETPFLSQVFVNFIFVPDIGQ